MIIVPPVGTNRIEVSSPVPVGNDSAEATLYDQRAKFGNAVYNLGNELDKINKRAEKSNDGYIVASAVADLENKLLLRKREIEISGMEENDPTGTSSVQKFEEYEAGLRQELLTQLPARVHLQFEAASKGIRNEYIQKTVASEVDKRVKMTGALRAQAIQRYARTVYDDPSKFDDSVLSVNVLLQEEAINNTITEMELAIAQPAATAELARSLVNGHLARAEFGQAQAAFESKRHFWSAEDQGKEQKRIYDASIGYRNDVFTGINQERTQADWAEQDQQDVLMKQIMTMYDAAGSNQQKINMVEDMVRKSTLLTGQQKMQLMDFRRQTSRPGDEYFESKILDGALKGEGALTLAKKIDKGVMSGHVTWERANDLKDKVRALTARTTNNPMISKQISAYQTRMKALVAPPKWESMIGYTAENNPRYADLNSVFMSELARVAQKKSLTPADVGAAYSFAMKQGGLGHMTRVQPGFGEVPMSQTDSVQDLQTKRSNLIDNYMREKSKKGMTKERSKEFKNELQRLDINIQDRKIRDEVKGRTSSQAVQDLVD